MGRDAGVRDLMAPAWTCTVPPRLATARAPINTPPPGDPQIRLTALVACGTRAPTGTSPRPVTRGETVYGQHLMRCLHENMIVLLDRGFTSGTFLAAVARTAPTSWPACRPPASHRSCVVSRTAPSFLRSARITPG